MIKLKVLCTVAPRKKQVTKPYFRCESYVGWLHRLRKFQTFYSSFSERKLEVYFFQGELR